MSGIFFTMTPSPYECLCTGITSSKCMGCRLHATECALASASAQRDEYEDRLAEATCHAEERCCVRNPNVGCEDARKLREGRDECERQFQAKCEELGKYIGDLNASNAELGQSVARLHASNEIREILQRTCDEYETQIKEQGRRIRGLEVAANRREAAPPPSEFVEILKFMRDTWPLGPSWSARTEQEDAILRVVAAAIDKKIYQLRVHVDQRIDEGLKGQKDGPP